MNYPLLSRQLGIICMLIGGTMVFSLPWSYPYFGHRTSESVDSMVVEWSGLMAIGISIVVCFALGGILFWFGRHSQGHLFRKEAMAVVGLSWVLATVLGALPFSLSGTYRGPGVRFFGGEWQVYEVRHRIWGYWTDTPALDPFQQECVVALLETGARGLSEDELNSQVQPPIDYSNSEQQTLSAAHCVSTLAETNPWKSALLVPGQEGLHDDGNYRVRFVRMDFCDALFESQSGFSTTGATVISDLEDPELVPHSILFWRSSTHFLGGLGIIVLFVAVLGQGSAGKALMRAEMPGPSKEGSQTRMQHTALLFASIYLGLNAILTLLLWLMGMTWFDALCHAFGTMATGGFSTYNASVGQFQSASIDYTITLFMILAGTNFALLYLILQGRPKALFADAEWRVYMLLIVGVTLLIMGFGLVHGDFADAAERPLVQRLSAAFRYGLFQVVAIITTTGYGTHNFDAWNNFGRGALLILMFVGGCAGSTGGGMKVIRHILFVKILRLEVEHAFHPTVVRPLKLSGNTLDDPELRRNILVYFGLVLIIFVLSWIALVALESDATWGGATHDKLIDSASAIAATLNNIGPGLGTVGATQNYGHFSGTAKLLFTWLMMLGRLEIFVILVLVVPRFWRDH